MENISSKRFATVGRCIYCASTEDVEDEHIVPLALGGTAVLPKSSCRSCAAITGKQEQIVLRGSMWPVRVFSGLKSRTKHRSAPKTYPLTVIRHGVEEEIELPADEYPILLPFPVFGAPAFDTPGGYKSGIDVIEIRTISFGPHPEAVIRKLGAETIKITRKDQPVAFARVIAKIAYAAAAADGLLDLIDGTPAVVHSILGSDENIGRWVGTMPGVSEPIAGHLHRILFHRDDEKGIVFSEVQLFSDSQTPRYVVILGKVRC